jgi:large subunit ribosomal protein L35
MPKMKTRKSAAKRVLQSANGKFLFRHTGQVKKKLSKSGSQKRRLSLEGVVEAGVKMLSRQLPYGMK